MANRQTKATRFPPTVEFIVTRNCSVACKYIYTRGLTSACVVCVWYKGRRTRLLQITMDEDVRRTSAMSSSSKRVYYCMILLGLGYLAPYNSVLTAVDYFSDKFGSGMEYFLAAALVCPNVIFLAISVAYGLPWSEKTCIVGGFATLLLGCVAMPFLKWSWSILTLAFIMGLATATTQGSLFSICGICSPEHTAALTTGTGMAGSIICFIRMATKSAPSQRTSVLAFFTFSAVLCAVCILAYVRCVASSLFFLHRKKAASDGDSRTESQLEAPLVDHMAIGDLRVDDSGGERNDAAAETGELKDERARDGGDGMTTKDIVVRLRKGIMAVILVFLVTLALFPGLVSEMKSSNVSDDWWSLILFTVFNVTDTIGKFLPSVRQYLNLDSLLLGSVIRVSFIPLFVICVSPDIISWDWLQAIIVAIFGVSNGYLGTVAMMLGPAQVEDSFKEKAGLVMVFFLTSGLAIGSWTGVGLKNLMDNSPL